MAVQERAAISRTWEAPGPGFWQRDDVHSPRAMTRYMIEIFNPAFDVAMRDMFRNYGLPLDHFDIRMVGQHQYMRPQSIMAPAELRSRERRAAKVIARKLWRQDISWWRNELAAKLRRTNLKLQQVEPTTLEDAALRAHIAVATSTFVEAVKLHFRLFPAEAIPVGDWLRHTCAWTGTSPAQAIAILQGNAGASVAPLGHLDQLTNAIRSVPAAIDTLHAEGSDAQTRIERLRASSPEVARALDMYLDEYGLFVISGFDLCDMTLRELPGVLVDSLAAHLDKPATTKDKAEAREAAASLYAQVPAALRAEYDELLEEARFAYGSQDENVGITFHWPVGLLRRALLAAGKRLVARGVIKHAEHLLDATPTEIGALLGGPGTALTATELADRAEERRLLDLEEFPLALGEPEALPPADLLPPACLRMTLGLLFYQSDAHPGDPQGTSAAKERQDAPSTPPGVQKVTLQGLSASGGRYEGRARVVRGPSDFEHIREGDVLVVRTTSTAYNVILPLLGAVVTDRGGVLCHAAIVAREFGIPGVVGTGDATVRIPDGARIVVDGDRGVVEILS